MRCSSFSPAVCNCCGFFVGRRCLLVGWLLSVVSFVLLSCGVVAARCLLLFAVLC